MKRFTTSYLYKAPLLQKDLKRKPEEYWIKRGEKMALNLFSEASKRVPAYKDFLRKNNINPKKVNTIEEFKKVPTINKDNYLKKYSREELSWDGDFKNKSWTISATSGSTGEPFYFPRTSLQDDYYALTAEVYLRENFNIQEKSTLYIDAFALGIWIGGIFTYEAIKKVADRGYEISIMTPGINKQEVINCIKNLARHFDQVIIGCYPPILKDIVDLGIEEGINWGEYNLGVVFSAEGFSEDFRDYIIEKAQLKDIYRSTLNHYGTVDLGTMSHETPLTTLIRKQTAVHKELNNNLFGHTTKMPTLTQFLPEMYYFETKESHLVCTSDGGFPLVRYDLNDLGGVLTNSTVSKIYDASSLNLQSQITQASISKSVWNIPFVYLYERADMSVTFSAAQIYPEEIRKALLDTSIRNFLTGKFTMISDYNKKAQNYLEINVELKIHAKPSVKLIEKTRNQIVKVLCDENSEYRVLYDADPKKVTPIIVLWDYSHEEHFSGKGKHKWVKK